MVKAVRRSAGFLLFLAAMLLFLAALFFFDNKYTMKMPLPQGGVLTLTEESLSSDQPIFLIDDWQLSSGICPPGTVQSAQRTWIGEFSNYRLRNDPARSPFGSGTYRLQLAYTGADTLARLYFPDLCEEYILWWDDALISSGHASAQTGVLLTEGSHTLTLAVTAKSGYYAGMYFPGAIGSDRAVSRLVGVQSAVYEAAALIPLILALFCLCLWARTGSGLRGKFGFLCLGFCLSLSRYFLQLYPSALSPYRFLLSDLALYAMLYCALSLMLEAAGAERQWFSRPLRLISCVLPAVEIALYFCASAWADAIRLHGFLQNGYRIFLFVCLVSGGAAVGKHEDRICRWILCAGSALGLGLLLNLAGSNLFEPIYTLWQFEWCSLAMVVLFAVTMEEQNRKILLENETYQTHLKELVDERTHQLTCVLDERRAFFSDMAHDLKAPLSSLKAFITIIRTHGVGLDNELQFYLEQVERQQEEMSRRVGSLNELNAVDRLTAAPERVTAAELLQELNRVHSPEASVIGVHLIFPSDVPPLTILVQRKKLLLAFENLIYNALRFTPEGGVVRLCAEEDGERIRISVSDTGCGIPAEELPHVFQRFYMGQAGKATGGSGLGLYIAKAIVTELGGEISAQSEPGRGTTFTISLPLCK